MVAMTPTPTTCTAPAQPATGGNWHSKTKLFIDLAVLAMACDLTRVVTIQYSDSWGVNYSDYTLGTGTEALGTWSDHFISHKLDDTDRATDLDGLPRADAQRIADARVVPTSRFKVRRFAYLRERAQAHAGRHGGSLLDESLVMFAPRTATATATAARTCRSCSPATRAASRPAAWSRRPTSRPARCTRRSSSASASTCRATARPAGSPIADL